MSTTKQKYDEAERLTEQQMDLIEPAIATIKSGVRMSRLLGDREVLARAREAAEILATESDNLFRWLAQIERDIPKPATAASS